jgi:hypothetical protein
MHDLKCAAEADRELVADELAEAVGQDGRLLPETVEAKRGRNTGEVSEKISEALCHQPQFESPVRVSRCATKATKKFDSRAGMLL